MLNTVRDLFGHEAWADAEHFRAFLAHAPAAADDEIRERLNHIHMVQRWYLKLFQGTPLGEDQKLEPLASTEELRSSTRQYHEEMRALLESIDAGRLSATISLPRLEHFHPSTYEAMLQMVMHSQNHRGQNARRLRELGGQPPLTDYLFWLIKGRPVPDWGA